MGDLLFFRADNPVTLRWKDQSGAEVSRRGRLHRVSQSAISVMLLHAVSSNENLRIGG